MPKSLTEAERGLSKQCPVMRQLIRTHGPCTLLKNKRPHFHSLVSSIISQQLSVKAAQTISNRTKERVGAKKNFKAEHFKGITVKQLRACGLSNAKARYVLEIYRHVASGKLPLRSIGRKPDEEIRTLLQKIPGIGPWTVDMFMMFSLNRLDILPLGDLAIRKGICNAYTLDINSDHEQLRAAVDHLRPWRTIACWYLWRQEDQ